MQMMQQESCGGEDDYIYLAHRITYTPVRLNMHTKYTISRNASLTISSQYHPTPQIALHHLSKYRSIPFSPPNTTPISSSATSHLTMPNPPACPRITGMTKPSSTSPSHSLLATSLPQTLLTLPDADMPPAADCMRALDASVTYSSYAMLKLHVSLSWMMSRRAAAMSRERPRVERCGIRKSLESGALRALVGAKGVSVDRVAVGRKKELSTAETDLVR
jgi:hypothetical protein